MSGSRVFTMSSRHQQSLSERFGRPLCLTVTTSSAPQTVLMRCIWCPMSTSAFPRRVPAGLSETAMTLHPRMGRLRPTALPGRFSQKVIGTSYNPQRRESMARQTCISVLQLLLLVSGLAATGCGSPAASPRADPINYHLLCLADTGSQTVTCDPRERLAQFNAFAKEAIHRPHSTFTVWQIGPDRPAARPFFSACVPDRWGSHVMKAKTDFIQKAREGAAGSRSGLSEPAGCHPPGTTSPGSTKLVIL